MFICILCLLGGTVCTAFQPAAAEEPPGLPDLWIGGIGFDIIYSSATSAGVWSAVNITVHVGGWPSADVTPANLTIYANSMPLGTAPVEDSIPGYPGFFGTLLLWNTGSLAPGNYTIRAEVNASNGDADPSNNALERNFTLGAGPPVLTVAFESDTFTAEPSKMTFPEDRRTSVECNFSVQASNLAGRLLFVTVNASLDNGWEPFFGWSHVYIDTGAPVRCSVRVTVPPGARADRPGNLTLTAHAMEGIFNVSAVAAARVVLGGYWSMQLDSGAPYMEVPPGEPVVFTVGLTNWGNAEDSFSLEVENQNDLSKQHASAVLSCRTLENVGPGEMKTFKVTFRGSQDWTLYKSKPTIVVVKATSLGSQAANRTVDMSFPAYAYEKGSFPAWYIAYPVAAGAMVLLLAPVVALALWIRKRKRAGK